MKQNDHAPGAIDRMAGQDRSAAALIPIMAVVFIAYLVIGLAMPVLPIYVHLDLGLSTFVVELVSGSQFAASFFSRMWAGHHADKRGPKHTVVAGLLIAAVSGLLYLVSLRFAPSPVISVGIVLLGRAVLGVAESLIVTGALSWGLALMGPQNTGKVMSWVGTSLYAAFAVGAPAGTALYAAYGFAAIALTATLIPLAVLPLVASMRTTSAISHTSAGLIKVAGAVWLPGLGVALAGWIRRHHHLHRAVLRSARMDPGMAGVHGIERCLHCRTRAVRPSAGPDRRREGRVGVYPDRSGRGTGADLAGAIVHGGFGRRHLKRPWLFPRLSGTGRRSDPPRASAEPSIAMGAYTVCLDLSLGLASPALGLVAGRGLGSVYLASTLVVLGSAFIALHLLNATAPRQNAIHFRCPRQEIPREASDRGNRIAFADGDAIGSHRGDCDHDRIKAHSDV